MKKTWILLTAVVLALPGSGYAQDNGEPPPPKAAPGADKAGDLETRVAALERQIADLTRAIEALNQKLDGGATVKKLPKAEERKAMRPVIGGGGLTGDGTTGRLMITNDSGCDEFLYINQRLWRVVPGKSYAVVPRGHVIVQRPGDAAQTLSDWQTEADGTHVVRYTYPRSSTVTVLSPGVIIWP